jgi:hypothetical protein
MVEVLLFWGNPLFSFSPDLCRRVGPLRSEVLKKKSEIFLKGLKRTQFIYGENISNSALSEEAEV